MRRGEREGKAPDWLRGKPGRGLARDMGGMVVENNLDRGVGGVGGVKKLEKLNEFTAAVAFLDQSVDVTGEQIDTRHQGQGAVAFVLVITHDGRAGAGKRRATGRGRTDRLNPGFLVVRDDDEAPAAVLALCSFATQHRDLPVDTEDFGHLGLALGITLFPVVVHPRLREGRLLRGLTSCSAKILHTVRWASFAKLLCPADGPCCRACAASNRVVHSSWGGPASPW